MKVTYIHHSSFLVETDENYFLFDYFEGELPEFKEDKPLLVFASHRHGDHFSPVIFARRIPFSFSSISVLPCSRPSVFHGVSP